MSDFQSRARAAAASISSMNPAEALAQSLLNDRPSIDSAVKAYMSLTAARSLSASDPNVISSSNASNKAEDIKTSLHNTLQNSDSSSGKSIEKCFFVKSKNPQQSSLLCARTLLKAINTFQIPHDAMPQKDEEKEEAARTTEKDNTDELNNLEFQVVRIVWNGLVEDKEKKPSRFLGRKSLGPIYNLIVASILDNHNDNSLPSGVDQNELICFMNEFGSLLKNAIKRKAGDGAAKHNKMQGRDDDSCLVWDSDGGKEELKRRRGRRKQKAKAANIGIQETDVSGLTIEEIPEGEEAEDKHEDDVKAT